MPLTTAQRAVLKTAIQADVTFNAAVAIADWPLIANAFNVTATPSFTVWRINVGITETGQQFVGTEWAAMTSANHTRLQTVAQWMAGGYNPSLADIRAMFDDIWSGAGGAATRARLLALWKRLALRSEKTFATGTGSDAAPATMTYEGPITADDVRLAMTT